MTLRQQILTFFCPKCHAMKGDDCQSKFGKKRTNPHIARLNSYLVEYRQKQERESGKIPA